ncbi:proclotting enzyme isoform X1 [Acyrthosiphon pisum]|uniref:Proclotting enzyme n=1 Tax=Acyrthosiphon pisum TaxID=7029 RepID=A0A8R1VZ23_ACYPI|nr:proclotting enzyme isoform X1 [Acyrthosiphon pisum]|eukprot:XP_001944076.1 PREDICTED: proclotting enzyme isoform X1 [Acyrthosiphon pisum]
MWSRCVLILGICYLTVKAGVAVRHFENSYSQAYDFTGRHQYHINRPPRQTVRESFHFPASDSQDHAGYSDVTYPEEGRSAKSGRRAKLPAEFQGPLPEEQTEYPPVGSEEARYLSPQAIAKISETLGAINTVGRYLVNYTRGTTDDRLDSPQSYPVSLQKPGDLPTAIFTISKNVLGRNMTDMVVKPLVSLGSGKVVSQDNRPCSTPDGSQGNCEDLSNCPQLLLNLGHLRQSICFKNLFVPGVCCPKKTSEPLVPEKPSKPEHFVTQTAVTRPPINTRPPSATRPPPANIITLSTKAPIQVATKPTTSLVSSNTIDEDCGRPEVPKFRVVGGDEALPGRWPWMAAIFLHGPRRTEFWCGGSLIGPRHILTAAHCTRDNRQMPFNARQFTVRLGDVDLRRDDEPSSPETYYVVEVRGHNKFSRVGFYNDIAILVLDRPVKRSKYTIPLCLPPKSSKSDTFVGQSPTVVGWGTTYYGGKESTVQRQVDLPVWNNNDCDRTYFQPINEDFICAGLKEGGKDACQGDSGGPLMLKKDGRWIQIGIVSFGNKCGEPGYPGVYTRVTRYLDWINDNIN